MLLEHTLNTVTNKREQAASLFFHRLQEIFPEGGYNTISDRNEQARRLVGMLRAAVSDHPSNDPPHSLSRRHAMVGAALLWTLEQVDDAFNETARKAWVVAYEAHSDEMLAALAA